MKDFSVLLLLGLLCAGPLTWAGEPGGMRGENASPELARVSMTEYARLRRDAGLRIDSLARRVPDAGALIDAIRTEVDPASREAQWNAWLHTVALSDELKPLELQALAELAQSTPTVGIPHHEFPSRTMPAFGLPARARALLTRHAQLGRARDLAGDPDALAAALGADVGSPRFEAGLRALELLSPSSLADIVEAHLNRASGADAESMILLRAAELEPGNGALLADVVRRGDARTARRALVLAMDRSVTALPEIAAAALARGELGGLALAAARQSGMHPDDFCWSLLGDSSLGADAARMLAESSDRLLPEISARLADASGLARLRMLLALRMRDSEASRAMLAELAEAAWLSEQQRREVRSWR